MTEPNLHSEGYISWFTSLSLEEQSTIGLLEGSLSEKDQKLLISRIRALILEARADERTNIANMFYFDIHRPDLDSYEVGEIIHGKHPDFLR